MDAKRTRRNEGKLMEHYENTWIMCVISRFAEVAGSFGRSNGLKQP